MQCTRKEAAILQQIYIHNILTIFTEWCIIIDINAESMNIYSSREQKMEKAFLVLATGETIEGNHIGATGCSIGELVFTTGMEGYTETLTDPSYAGQTVIQTFPLIGNYGVNAEDCEGVPALSGYVVSECCDTPSNFRAECTVDGFLKEHGICGISGIDTRYLTKMIRAGGTVNAAVTDSLPEDIGGLVGKLKNYSVSGAVGKVSTKKTVVYPAYGERKFSVVLVDYGAKKNITESLRKLGCEVTVVPHDTGAEKILALCPDGVMLSNGPGDPAENVGCIAEIKKLIGKVPVFGICLGHQLTALAMGATDYQIISKVLLPEALPGIVAGLTISFISLISASAMAGAIGGGGLGDMGIRYGYQRFMPDVMCAVVVILIAFVQSIQSLGDWIVLKLRHK